MQARKTENLQKFAARLKAAMARRGLTLQEIANHLGKSVSTVGAWTQAKNFPATDLQPGLADLLGLSLTHLMHGISVAEETEAGRVEEPAAPYFSAVPRPGRAPQPTAQHCLDHMRQFLEQAEKSPGGLGYTYRLLLKHFPLDEFQTAPAALVPVTLPSQTTLLSTATGKPHPSPSPLARPA